MALSNYENMALGKFNVDYEERVNFDRMRKDKHARAIKCMEQDNLCMVATWNADNCRYLASVYLTTPNRAGEYQFVSFTRNGVASVYSGVPDEAKRRMPWLNGRVYDAFGSALKAGGRSGDHPAIVRQLKFFLRDLEEAGLKPATCDSDGKVTSLNDGYIGIDGTSMPHVYIEGLQMMGYKAVWANVTLDKARAIKTPEEVKIMRQVAANTEVAFAAIVDAIRPGIKECELVGIGLAALYAEGIDHSEDLVCMSGENTNPYNWTFTDKLIRPGDPIYVDVDAASYLGYKSCVYRTFYCGRPTDTQRKAYDTALEMLRGGCDACKVGNTNYDIMKGFKADPVKTWGRDSWYGLDPWCLAHGCGLTLHDRPFVAHSYMENGGEEIPLEPGMVLAVETFAGLPEQRTGARLEDMVLITEDGGEIISRFPIDEPLVCWRDWAANTRGIIM
ncbi:MAG: aminopeptidase [Oscillospiraceae bacterium]|nr:aminopeptidase [Oscillospiraceae bacterium]